MTGSSVTLPDADHVVRILLLGSSNNDEIQDVYYPRELFVDTANWNLYLHDGVTAGGHAIAKADMSNVATANLLSAINNIPPNKIDFLTMKAVYLSQAGSDTYAGTNPQIPKATLANALVQTGVTDIICLDGSAYNLQDIPSGVTLHMPYSTLSVNTDVTIAEGAKVICKYCSMVSNILAVNGILEVLDTLNSTNYINGTGLVRANAISAGPFTQEFTGSIECPIGKALDYEPYDSMKVTLQTGVYLCDGSTVTITEDHNALVAQMEAYLSDPTTGVYTLSTDDAASSYGDYFVYDSGASTFQMPYMVSSRQNGLENFSRSLYSGFPTSAVSFDEDAVVHFATGGTGGGTGYAYIYKPDGTYVNFVYIGVHNSSKASGGAGTFILPKGWQMVGSYGSDRYCKVYSKLDATNPNNYKKIKLY